MKPHNPGLSQQAWIKLHKLLAAANIKYAAQIQQKGEKKVG